MYSGGCLDGCSEAPVGDVAVFLVPALDEAALFFQKLGSPFGIGFPQGLEPYFCVHVAIELAVIRLLGVQLEGILSLGLEPGVVTVQRPDTGLDRRLLLVHALHHVDSLVDAVGVGDDD